VILYYDRDGAPLDTVWEWAALVEDREYVIVQQDTLERGENIVEVSTIWLGLNHNWSGIGPPIIFETMVFTDEEITDQHRYSTEEEARLGHAGVLEMEGLKLMVNQRKEQEAMYEDEQAQWPERKLL
jgi:hypothetical protein